MPNNGLEVLNRNVLEAKISQKKMDAAGRQSATGKKDNISVSDTLEINAKEAEQLQKQYKVSTLNASQDALLSVSQGIASAQQSMEEAKALANSANIESNEQAINLIRSRFIEVNNSIYSMPAGQNKSLFNYDTASKASNITALVVDKSGIATNEFINFKPETMFRTKASSAFCDVMKSEIEANSGLLDTLITQTAFTDKGEYEKMVKDGKNIFAHAMSAITQNDTTAIDILFNIIAKSDQGAKKELWDFINISGYEPKNNTGQRITEVEFLASKEGDFYQHALGLRAAEIDKTPGQIAVDMGLSLDQVSTTFFLSMLEQVEKKDYNAGGLALFKNQFEINLKSMLDTWSMKYEDTDFKTFITALNSEFDKAYNAANGGGSNGDEQNGTASLMREGLMKAIITTLSATKLTPVLNCWGIIAQSQATELSLDFNYVQAKLIYLNGSFNKAIEKEAQGGSALTNILDIMYPSTHQLHGSIMTAISNLRAGYDANGDSSAALDNEYLKFIRTMGTLSFKEKLKSSDPDLSKTTVTETLRLKDFVKDNSVDDIKNLKLKIKDSEIDKKLAIAIINAGINNLLKFERQIKETKDKVAADIMQETQNIVSLEESLKKLEKVEAIDANASLSEAFNDVIKALYSYKSEQAVNNRLISMIRQMLDEVLRS